MRRCDTWRQTDQSKGLRDSERVGAYLSREHGEGGSFVWQMRVDMVMLLWLWRWRWRRLWWWWWWVVKQHLVAANLVWGHVGRRLRAEGGRGKWDVLVSVGLTSVWVKQRSHFQWALPAAAIKPRESSGLKNKINSYWLHHVMHWGDIPNKSTWTLTILRTLFSFLIPSNEQVNYLPRRKEVIGLCVVAPLYHCLSLDMYVYHNYNLQKAC